MTVLSGAGGVQRSTANKILSRVGSPLMQLVLAAIAVFWLIPTFGLLIASLRPESANSSSGWWTVLSKPSQLTLDSYRTLLSDNAITKSFVNTVLITVPATLLVIVIGSMAAYAVAWIEFKGRDWLFIAIIGLLVVPIQVALIPVATLYGKLHVFGSIPSLVAFHVAFGLPFAIFLLRNFFAGIPRDLLEAARMDGAGEWTIFTRVILPLGLPAIASLGIFQFLWVWNDLLVALIFANSNSAPLTVYLSGQTRQFGSNIDLLASGSFLSLIVPLLVFFAFQRFFVQGVMAGSVK
ncbi:MAG: carbohydrate ABC transporter permease [Nocardioidaceae bacterium]